MCFKQINPLKPLSWFCEAKWPTQWAEWRRSVLATALVICTVNIRPGFLRSFPGGPICCRVYLQPLSDSPTCDFLLILKTQISMLRCVWLGLGLKEWARFEDACMRRIGLLHWSANLCSNWRNSPPQNENLLRFTCPQAIQLEQGQNWFGKM